MHPLFFVVSLFIWGFRSHEGAKKQTVNPIFISYSLLLDAVEPTPGGNIGSLAAKCSVTSSNNELKQSELKSQMIILMLPFT